jgi:hypothetical protein
MRARILTTAEETDNQFDLVDAVKSAGEMTPLHVHTRDVERFYIVSGSFLGQPPVSGPTRTVLMYARRPA